MSNDGTGVPSFDAFANHTGLRPRLKGCYLAQVSPEVRAQVEGAWAKGYRWRAINAYLTAIEQPAIPDGQLQRHFGVGHVCT